MKKKGLIISTVVMVVVLIAALTTTTFAWFTATSDVKIDTITMQADSAASLKIGVVSDNSFALPTSISTFLSGDLDWSETKWTGAPGMGPLVTFNEDLNFLPEGRAVGLASAQMSVKDSATIKKGEFYTGTAQVGTSDLDTTTAEAAKKETDYLDVTLGVMPVKDKEVKQAYLHITVTATDPAKIGMAAAIHFAFRLQNTKTPTETLIDPATCKNYATTQTGKFGDEGVGIFDTFAGLTYAQGWAGDETTHGTYTKAEAKWELWIEILKWNSNGYSNTYAQDYSGENIALLQIMAWLDGNDDSCVTANAGTGGNITFEFVSYAEQYEQKSDAKPGSTPTKVGAAG